VQFIILTKERQLGKIWRRASFLNGELYLIIFLAGFLCFYRIDTSSFDRDQGLMWRMAYDAVHHGLLPITAGTSSLGFANAPGPVYFLMIPAAITDNPIAGVIFTSLLAIVAVVITYIFTTCYYGRVAGTLAALLYGTATMPLFYSRFVWQPNLMPPFVILFMFALFRGVVERRNGWLFPALLLLGILYQTHGTTMTLLAPLGLAVLFAPETIRRRNIVYAMIALAIIFFPFLLWQIATHFSDLSIILTQITQKAVTNDNAYSFYRYLLSPYDPNNPPTNPKSYVKALMPAISKLHKIVFFLVVCGLILAVALATYQWVNRIRFWSMANGVRRVQRWITPTPEGAGLLLLCVWQFAPVLALTKHSVELFPHYLLVVMPGPFILAGYFIARLGAWIHRPYSPLRTLLCLGLYGMALLVVLAQLVGSIASIRDRDHGNFVDTVDGRYFNDFGSLERVIHDADQLADQQHLKRVFIGTDFSTEYTMYYFGEHMRHQATVFTIQTCLMLPNQADGPAILIMPPYAPMATGLVEKSGATLLEVSPRLSGEPFKIYEIYPSATQVSSPENTFAQNIQSVAQGNVDKFQGSDTSWMVSNWMLLRNRQPSYAARYSYRVVATLNDQVRSVLDTVCTFNAAQAGDQMLVASSMPFQGIIATAAMVKVMTYNETPDTPVLGPFHLESHRLMMTPLRSLQTNTGKDSINLPI